MGTVASAPLERHLHKELVRTRLLSHLSTALESMHVLVHGGPGFGKTTLLRQLASRQHGAVYWFDLQFESDEALSFLAHLSEVKYRSLGEQHTEDGRSARMAARGWSHDTATTPTDPRNRSCPLVILDHLPQDAEDLHMELGRMLSFPKLGARLVVCARDLPSFFWARLELSQLLFRLGSSNLAFTPEETLELATLERVGHRAATALHQLTEGWPLAVSHGLRKIRLSPTRLTKELPSLLASDTLLRQYLMDEVLHAQADTSRKLLFQTSFLPNFSELDLDDFVRHDREPVKVASIRNVDGLLHVSEHDIPRYRYNPILRTFLRATANTMLPRRELEELTLHAAKICETRGLVDDARSNYMLAGAFHTAADLLERVADDYLEAYMLEAVRNWSSELPQDVQHSRPWILAYQGKALRRLGKIYAALPLLESALELFEKQSNAYGIAFTCYELSLGMNGLGRFTDAIVVAKRAIPMVGEDHALRSRLLVPICMSCAAKDDYGAAIRAGQASLEALKHIPTNSFRPILESRTRQYLARAHARSGNYLAARREAEESLRLCDEFGLGNYKRVWSLHSLALALTIGGKRDDALAALDEADRCGQRDNPLQQRELDLIRGYIALEQHDLDRAEALLKRCGSNGRHLVAYAALLRGEHERAREYAERAVHDLATRESPVDFGAALVIRGRVHAATGDLSAASCVVRSAIDIFSKHLAVQALASAWLLLGIFESQDASLQDRAVQSLHQATSTARANSITHMLWCDVDILIAGLEAASPENGDRDFLAMLLRLEAEKGNAFTVERLSVWKHPLAFDMVKAIPANRLPRVVQAEASLNGCTDTDLRKRLVQLVLAERVEPAELIHLRTRVGLTWREIEVYFRYVSAKGTLTSSGNRRNRSQVAATLHMSENTLKVHAANIRRKLRSIGCLEDPHDRNNWEPASIN